MAVANKQVDVATNNTENMTRLEKTNPEAAAKIKVIWKSPLIPSDPIVWNKDLDQADQGQAPHFPHDLWPPGHAGGSREGARHPHRSRWAPFRPSSDAQLYPIRIMEVTKQMFQVEGDDNLRPRRRRRSSRSLRPQKAEYEALMAKVPQA